MLVLACDACVGAGSASGGQAAAPAAAWVCERCVEGGGAVAVGLGLGRRARWKKKKKTGVEGGRDEREQQRSEAKGGRRARVGRVVEGALEVGLELTGLFVDDGDNEEGQ